MNRECVSVGGWIVATVIGLAVIVLLIGSTVSPPPPPEFIATPVPDPVPNMTPDDYAAMSGFDASTEQTLREQVRHNDLQWRVEKLEREVRRLNQRVYGIAELRIGDEPPPNLEGTE